MNKSLKDNKPADSSSAEIGTQTNIELKTLSNGGINTGNPQNDSHQPLVTLEIVHLIKFSDQFAGIEIHLMVGTKFVKLNYAHEQFIDILRKLQQKKVSKIYVRKSDCEIILKSVQNSLAANNFYDPSTQQHERVATLNSGVETLKQMINQFGIEKETIHLFKEINERAMGILKESSTIFAFVKEFRSNCSEEFLKSIITNYILSLVIDKFSWQSEAVKIKSHLASYLCDIVLDKSDLETLQIWNKDGGILSDKIRNHPHDICNKLIKDRSIIPHETITIIEQHHEKPNGKGFPSGITSSRFNQLSAIFIVCQQFTEKLHESGFNFQLKLQIVSEIQSAYDYSSSSVFRKAINALEKVVN